MSQEVQNNSYDNIYEVQQKIIMEKDSTESGSEVVDTQGEQSKHNDSSQMQDDESDTIHQTHTIMSDVQQNIKVDEFDDNCNKQMQVDIETYQEMNFSDRKSNEVIQNELSNIYNNSIKQKTQNENIQIEKEVQIINDCQISECIDNRMEEKLMRNKDVKMDEQNNDKTKQIIQEEVKNKVLLEENHGKNVEEQLQVQVDQENEIDLKENLLESNQVVNESEPQVDQKYEVNKSELQADQKYEVNESEPQVDQKQEVNKSELSEPQADQKYEVNKSEPQADQKQEVNKSEPQVIQTQYNNQQKLMVEFKNQNESSEEQVKQAMQCEYLKEQDVQNTVNSQFVSFTQQNDSQKTVSHCFDSLQAKYLLTKTEISHTFNYLKRILNPFFIIRLFIFFFYTISTLMIKAKTGIVSLYYYIINFITLMYQKICKFTCFVVNQFWICYKEEKQKNDQYIEPYNTKLSQQYHYLATLFQQLATLFMKYTAPFRKAIQATINFFITSFVFVFSKVFYIPKIILFIFYNLAVVSLIKCSLIIQLFIRLMKFIWYLIKPPVQPAPPTPPVPPAQPKEYPIALLIGEAGAGKSQFYNKINDTEALQYEIIDTSSFDFKNDIEQRERQIQEFQNIFYSKPNKVATLFFVVKFERTDLMRRSILNIYPYFKKFQSQITLVVTHFDLSDDQEQDKLDLQRAFQIFKAKSILFVGQEATKEELINQIKVSDCLIPIEEGYQFDLSDTIFERPNEQEGQEFMNALQQLAVRQ